MTDLTQAATPERVAAGAPDIPSRVRAGAAWLDQHRPGWLQRIDLITLDLGEPECCVLGQIDGEYRQDAIGDKQAATAFGFDHGQAPADCDDRFAWDRYVRDVANEYTALTDAWRDLIEVRLTDEVRRIARACCPCRGAVCDPGCTCPSKTCPKTEAELTDDE